MKAKLVITTLSICIFVAACGKDSSKDQHAAARDIYRRNCAVCHGDNGEGRPLGGVRAPSLKSEDARKQTDERMFDWIYKGSSNMPSFKNSLTEEQVKALVRFIRGEIQATKTPS
jgi:mono/diheme cytochrome c family protein